MSHEVEMLLGLFVVFISAQIGAEIAQRLKMPGVVGEIAAGCLIGPSVLNWIHIDSRLEVIAEIGAVLLLFAVGLETRLDDLKKVGRVATTVGVLGVAAAVRARRRVGAHERLRHAQGAVRRRRLRRHVGRHHGARAAGTRRARPLGEPGHHGRRGDRRHSGDAAARHGHGHAGRRRRQHQPSDTRVAAGGGLCGADRGGRHAASCAARRICSRRRSIRARR